MTDAEDPLAGANCHTCGETADNFQVSDDLWQRVGLSGQVCFKCFRIAAWHLGIRPDPAWFVSLSDPTVEHDLATADSAVFEQSMWKMVAERDEWRWCAHQLRCIETYQDKREAFATFDRIYSGPATRPR